MKLQLLIFFLVLTVIPALTQTTYFVNINGNNSNSGLSESNAWRTITYAASSSSPVSAGDVIHIKAGDYGNENVIFQTSGTAINPIRYIGYKNVPGDNPNLNYQYGDSLDENVMPLLDGNDRTTGTGVILHNREFVELHNLQIQDYSIGLYAYKGKNLLLKNIIATTFGDTNAAYDGKGIIVGSLAENNVIEDCVVLNACAEGLGVYGHNNIIKNSRVYGDDNSTGVKSAMDYYIHVAGNYNLIEDCYIERVGNIAHGGHGFDLKGACQHNIIRNCVSKGMSNTGYELRQRGSQNNLIENCLAIGCGYKIRDGASNNIIRNCKTESANNSVSFVDAAEDEGAQYAGRNNRFENCIFQNTIRSQIQFQHWGSAEISDVDQNYFINCIFDGGDFLFNADRKNYDNGMSNCIVMNVDDFVGSSFYSTPFPINFDFSDTYFYNNGFTTPAGNQVTTANPLFVNAANNDYQLTAASPCIDTGNNTGAPTIDYLGNPRPYNGIVDIGAYEYGSNSGCSAAGTPCDDGNPDTINDVEDGNCNCAGSCPPAGTPCDDGNPGSYFDIADGNCNCAGISVCPSNITQNSLPIQNGVYQAEVSIYSAGFVNTFGMVDMKAGGFVQLEESFEVEVGGVFHAYIQGCEEEEPSCPDETFINHTVTELTSSTIRLRVELIDYLPMRLAYYPSSNPSQIQYRQCEHSTNYQVHAQTISGLSAGTEYTIVVQSSSTIASSGAECPNMIWEDISCPIMITTSGS